MKTHEIWNVVNYLRSSVPSQPIALKIVVADDLPASALELLRAERLERRRARRAASPPTLAADLADADALLVRSATKVTAELLAAAPRLRIVARAGTGVDNIDVAAASARGVLVVNAPGANSISVAEHALRADAGAGAVGAGRRSRDEGRQVGEEEVSRHRAARQDARHRRPRPHRPGSGARARAPSACAIVAHDPFISQEIAAGLGVELLSLDELCADGRLPDAAPAVDAGDASTCSTTTRFARVQAGHPHHQHRARRADRRSGAAPRDRERASSAAPALDVFEKEPPADWSLAQLPQVVATPHIAASTEEAQELVGLDTAADGPRLPARRRRAQRREFPVGSARRAAAAAAVDPAGRSARRRSSSQMGTARIEALGVRYYGALAESRGVDVLAVERGGRRAAADPVGRRVDRERPRRRPRARHRHHRVAQLAAAPLHQPGLDQAAHRATANAGPKARSSSRTARGWCRCAASTSKRRSAGTMLIIANDDQPGVIGEVGTILGRHGVNIANFALGRSETGAVGVVNVDEDAGAAPRARQRRRGIAPRGRPIRGSLDRPARA